MDRMIYLSMAGAKAAMQRQDVLSHNLANVTTNGFRAELQAFRAVPVRGDGASTRAYGLETSIGYNDEPGPLTMKILLRCLATSRMAKPADDAAPSAMTSTPSFSIHLRAVAAAMSGLFW